jgi:Glycosyl hydrolase family 26
LSGSRRRPPANGERAQERWAGSPGGWADAGYSPPPRAALPAPSPHPASGRARPASRRPAPPEGQHPPASWGQPAPAGYPPRYGQPERGQPGYGPPGYGPPEYGDPDYGYPEHSDPGYGYPAAARPGDSRRRPRPGDPAPRARNRNRLPAAPAGAAEWERNPGAWYRSPDGHAPRERAARRAARPGWDEPPRHWRQPAAPPAGQRRTPWFTIVALTLGLAVATYGVLRFGYGPQGNHGRPGTAVTSLQSHRLQGFPLRSHYIGMATKTPFQTTLPRIEHDLGTKPGIVEYYMAFGHAFPLAQTEYLDRLKILPLIQINPKISNLHEIAIGKYDGYLKTFAAEVRKVNAPVALSFAHEMNGWWYPWSVRAGTAQQVKYRPQFFVASWRHIHDVFQAEHVTNVTWVWTVSRDGTRPGWPDLQAWWPGSKYVNWVGMNGYFRTHKTDTFDYLYKHQIETVRRFTDVPILITETGVGPVPGLHRQVANLFAGVARTKNMLGFIWFDLNADEHWNVDTEPAAIKALHDEIARYPQFTH